MRGSAQIAPPLESMLFEAAGRWIVAQQDSAGTTATELMDTDPVPVKEFDDYLRDLERINVLTLAYPPTVIWLKRALADFPAERPISVLDVGRGGSGMLRQLRKWARGKNLKQMKKAEVRHDKKHGE